MRALVLAAGLGSRLASVTNGLPKVLVPVGGVPVLHRNLRWLAEMGIEDVAINLFRDPVAIRDSVGDGAAFGLRVVYSQEEHLLGTAGAAAKVYRELWADGEPCLVVYGDSICDFDLRALIRAHECAGHSWERVLVTLALFNPLTHLHTGICGGRVFVQPGGLVRGVVEGGADPGGLVNAGVYVCESEIVDFVRREDYCIDFMRDVFPAALAAGQRLQAHLIDGYVLGVDTPECLAEAEALLRPAAVVV